MTATPRPRSITLISWFWIILGGFTALYGCNSLGLLSKLKLEPDAPLYLKLLPVLVMVQIGVGLGGILSGVGFYLCLSWARRTLLTLSFLGLLYLILASGFNIRTVLRSDSETLLLGSGMMRPLGLMILLGMNLFYLQSDSIKKAMQ